MARTPRCPPPLRCPSGKRRRCRPPPRQRSPPARAHFHNEIPLPWSGTPAGPRPCTSAALACGPSRASATHLPLCVAAHRDLCVCLLGGLTGAEKLALAILGGDSLWCEAHASRHRLGRGGGEPRPIRRPHRAGYVKLLPRT
eukprot:scaffold12225_cov60-Phaeocystis_antarctica.AAC.1